MRTQEAQNGPPTVICLLFPNFFDSKHNGPGPAHSLLAPSQHTQEERTADSSKSQNDFYLFPKMNVFLDAWEGKSPSRKHLKVWICEGGLSRIGNFKLVKWENFVPKQMVL